MTSATTSYGCSRCFYMLDLQPVLELMLTIIFRANDNNQLGFTANRLLDMYLNRREMQNATDIGCMCSIKSCVLMIQLMTIAGLKNKFAFDVGHNNWGNKNGTSLKLFPAFHV